MKLKLLGGAYTNGKVHMEAGDVAEFSAEEAARICEDFPARFAFEPDDSAKPKDEKPAKKGRG